MPPAGRGLTPAASVADDLLMYVPVYIGMEIDREGGGG